ncbi:MAG: hypothetical protein IJ677_05490 [Alphaproteobacteria bacterium]|nr:hypothetical protein [Alphaproteobacteria bacterium]
MKTILEICREVADLSAVKRPDDLFNTTSQQNNIFLSVAKSTLDSLLRYGDWQELIKDGWIKTVKGKKQYIINDYIPDFYSLLNNTLYIKDTNEKVIGSVTPEQWMRDKCSIGGTLGTKFKFQNGKLVFSDEPKNRVKIVFQYRSNNIVWDFKTFEEKNTLTANTDVPIFDEYLVKLGILWRWLKRNGLDYSEEYVEYQRELKKRFGTSLAVSDINLAKNAVSNDEGVKINVCTIYNKG